MTGQGLPIQGKKVAAGEPSRTTCLFRAVLSVPRVTCCENQVDGRNTAIALGPGISNMGTCTGEEANFRSAPEGCFTKLEEIAVALDWLKSTGDIGHFLQPLNATCVTRKTNLRYKINKQALSLICRNETSTQTIFMGHRWQ